MSLQSEEARVSNVGAALQINKTETLMFRKYRRPLSTLAVVMAAIAFPAVAQTITVPPVPTDVQVQTGNTPFLKASAVGTQNYICLPTATGLAWKFQGPQATLFLTFKWLNTEVRQQIVTHFLSPNPAEENLARATWQSSIDTSTVWAKKIGESSDRAYVEEGAIPWFLLQVTGMQRGPSGGSLLSPTTFIQRVNTTGGVMPATGCAEAGKIAFVPYTAEYIFYRSTSSQ
jgi:hypothetical protein